MLFEHDLGENTGKDHKTSGIDRQADLCTGRDVTGRPVDGYWFLPHYLIEVAAVSLQCFMLSRERKDRWTDIQRQTDRKRAREM